MATRVKVQRLHKQKTTFVLWETHALPESDADGTPRIGGDSPLTETYRDARYMVVDDFGEIVVKETKWHYPLVVPPADV